MINFEDLNPGDYGELKKFFLNEGEVLSEYSQATVFMWNGCLYRVKKAFYGSRLLLSEVNLENENKKGLMLPLGGGKADPEELAGILKESGYSSYYYVPETYLMKNHELLEKKFRIYEQTGYADYLYSSKDLAELKGGKYSKKRNLIAQFEKNYLENNLIETIVLNKTNTADIKACFENWEKENQEDVLSNIRDCEKKAIQNAVDNWELYGDLFGVSFYLDKKIAGFTIGSRLNSSTAVLNFEKGNKKIKGLYQFMDREFARLLPPECVFINKESDLGKTGLIKAKESYHPLKKIKAYILELK